MNITNTCPECESEQTTGHSVTVTGKYAIQDYACDECLAEWTDLYKLLLQHTTKDDKGRPTS